MKADRYISYIDFADCGTVETCEEIFHTQLGVPCVAIREHDNSIIMFVLVRVEFMEEKEEVLERAARIAKALTVDKPNRTK